MLPVYISYFGGGGERNIKTTLKNSIAFVIGFTVVFILLGAFAGTVGSFFKNHQTVINIISGLLVIFFGLNFLGIIKLNIFKGSKKNINTDNLGFFSALLFGIIFSLGWTPCVGAFLGSALMLASQQGQMITGMIMLLFYSLGLGIPFILSAVLIDKLKSTFDFIKKHYGVINKVCGILLIIIGIFMATGMFGKLLALLS
jgi:cytochrome c-type biogenesis protein